jgi:ABC-type dipeptide/oligopeptide/nickel transport system permease component
MLRYIVRRSRRSVVQLLLLSIVAFVIIELPPGVGRAAYR